MKARYLFISLCLLLNFGCTYFDETVSPQADILAQQSVLNASDLRESAGVANINNPYAVHNMQQAMKQYCTFAGVQPRPVYATHEYVRFLPADSIQLYILEDSLELELFNYPLDRILTQNEIDFYSTDYVDGYCWTYTVVPKNYRYPADIRHEVLQDIAFINTASLEQHAVTDSFYDAVVAQAMKNTGIETVNTGAGTTGGGKWTPSAHISYVDDMTNEEIPLAMVKVRVNTLCNIGTNYTDAKGNVTITKGWGGNFLNPVDYQIKFKSDYWKIIENKTGVAEIFGNKNSSTAWYCKITPADKKGSAFAAVHRALHHIYCKQNSVTKPINPVWKMRVAVLWDTQGEDKYGDYRNIEWWGVAGNPIRIWGKEGDYRPRHAITGTVFHELCHASHHKAVRNKYFQNTDDKICESYARTWQYYFLQQLYPNRKRADFQFSYFSNYTGVGPALLYQDLSIEQIENTICVSQTWEEWEKAVKALKQVNDVITSFLFDTPNDTWEFNFSSESIITRDNTYTGNIGIPITFKLQQPLLAKNAQVVKWEATSTAYQIQSSTTKEAQFIFNKSGNYVVTATIRLPNGSTYKATKLISIINAATISGNTTSRIGIIQIYSLSNNNSFDKWELLYKKETSQGNWIDGIDYVGLQQGSALDKSNALNLIFYNPGEYKLRAHFDFNCIRRIVDKDITVLGEGAATNQKLASGIYPVLAYQHKTDKSIVHVGQGNQFNRIPTNCTLLGDEYKFRTFNRDITYDHPYANKLKPIYKVIYGGYDAYTPIPGSLLINNTITPGTKTHITGLTSTLVFYVLKEYVQGTMPLYSVNLIVTDSRGVVKSNCRYLSLQQLDKTQSIGFDKYTYKTMERLGYVYPLR